MATDWTAFEAVQDTPTNAPINWGDFEPENAAEKARLGAEMRSLRRQRMLGDAAEGLLGGAEAGIGVVARMNPVTAVANAADALGVRPIVPPEHIRQIRESVSNLLPRAEIPADAPVIGGTGNPEEDRAIAEGVESSVDEQLSGLTRPDQLALLGAGMKAPVPVARAFQVGSIAALPEAIQNVQQASERGDVGGTAKGIAGLTATAAIPALIEHGIPKTEIPVLPERVVRPPVTPEVTPERTPIPVPKKASAIPEVPSTPPEPMKGVSVIEEIRNANAQTKEAIRALYPQISREEAAALRKQAWGETATPIPEPKASEVSPAPERVQPTGEPEIAAPKNEGQVNDLPIGEGEGTALQGREDQPQEATVTEAPKPKEVPNSGKDWRVSVQSSVEETNAKGELKKIPGYVQIDDLTGGQNVWSKGPEGLRKEGYDVPDFSKLPQGQYTYEQAVKKLAELPKQAEVKLGVWPESEWSAASLAKQTPIERASKAKFLGLRDKDGQPISGPKTLADAAKKRIEEIKAAAAKPKIDSGIASDVINTLPLVDETRQPNQLQTGEHSESESSSRPQKLDVEQSPSIAWLKSIEGNNPEAILDATKALLGTSVEVSARTQRILDDINGTRSEIRTSGSNVENPESGASNVGTRSSQERGRIGQLSREPRANGPQETLLSSPLTSKGPLGEAFRQLSSLSDNAQAARGARTLRGVLSKDLPNSTKQAIESLIKEIVSYRQKHLAVINQPKETNARPHTQDAKIHGDLRTPPEPSPGQVPTQEGQRRIQSQTTGGLREPAQPARAEENKVALNEPAPATKAPESPTKAPESPSKSNLPTDMDKLRKLHNSLKQEMTDLELKFPPKGQAVPNDLQEAHNAVKQKFNEVHSEIVDRLWSEEKARMTPEPPPSEPKITNKILKAQKENLLEQVDKAIQEAPDHGPGKITISVPGDGDFTIRNVKPNLKAFREQAAKEFPATVGKMTEPGLASGKAKPIPKATKAPSIDETIKAAAKFVSNEPTREAINTVFSNGSQMVATDGRQLIRIWTDKAPGTPEKPVRLNEAGKPVDTDSQFPNYNAVIDPNPSLVLGGMETDQLWKLARQAQVFKNTYDNPTLGLDLVLNPDRTLGARMEQKDGDVFEHNVQKGALNLGTYNADFLVDQMDAARKLGNEKVDVYFHNDSTEGPIGFVGQNHESILMPMRGAVDEKGEYPDLHAKPSDFPANLVGARAHPRPTREAPAPKGKKAKGASVNISPGGGPKAGITPDPGLTGAIGDLIQAAGEIGGQIGGGGTHAALMPATQFGNGTLGIGSIWRNAPAKLKSLWGGFAMHELPDITRSDRATGEAGVRYAASPLVARTKGTIFAGKVLEGLKPEMDLKMGVALSEDNLRSIRKGYEDEAKQALAEGGILKAQKAKESADNVTTLVGQKNSPFKSEKEYQAFLKSPEAQTAIARHNALWEAEKDPLYRQANDLDPDLELETRGEQTGARVNLKHVMPGEATKTTVGRLAKSTLIKQTATLLRRDPFAIRAKGSGTSYEGSYTELMAHGFEREYPVAMQHEFIRSLIEAGDAVLSTREYPKGLEIKGEPTKAYLMKLKPFEGRFLQVRKSLAPEYQAVTGLDPALRLPIYSKVADFLTRQSVQGIAEGSNHIANIFTQAFTGLGPTSNPLLNSLIKVTGRPDVLWTLPKIAIKAFTDQRQRMLDLATIGATKEGFKGALGLGRLINRVDQGVRLVTDDVFKGMAKEGWVENTETERRHMVNQVGQYAKRLQPTIIRALRNTGINPFATATHTFMLQGIRELTLNPGVKAPTIAAAAALRVEKASGWMGLIVAVAFMNYMLSGKVTGPKGTKLLSVGWKDKDGKLQTFDVGKLTGYGRALDRTGIGPAIEANRQGLAPNTQIKKGIQAVGNTGVSYLAGPLNRFADVAITGSRPGVPQVQEAPLMPPRDDFAPLKSQTAANIKTALLQANPLIDAATSSAQGKETKEVVAKQLSRYVPKSGLNERTIAALPKIVKAGEMNDYVDGLAKQLRKLPREQRWMQAQKTLADSEMAAADRSRALQLLKRKRIFSFE
jgi:hypothetical protein